MTGLRYKGIVFEAGRQVGGLFGKDFQVNFIKSESARSPSRTHQRPIKEHSSVLPKQCPSNKAAHLRNKNPLRPALKKPVSPSYLIQSSWAL